MEEERLENEKLKSKDETYVNVFDCLIQFLDSRGFRISKVGEVQDAHVSNDAKDKTKLIVKFLCDRCDHETTSKNALETHKMAIHKIIQKCNICTFETEKKDELKKHKISSHLKILLKCKACNFEAESKENLKKHIDDVHESKKLCHIPK